MRKFNLEITVFISGAVIMILEIAGSRILAPYVGGSTFVWTSLIGIIMASLSLGYYIGGRIGDKKHNPRLLSFLILLAALSIAFITWIKEPVLSAIQASDLGIREASLLGTLILFTVPSVLLGTISPYAIRLKMTDIETSGTTIGNLYAISTVGSIVGTFLAGFYLISYFGNTNLFLLLAGIMAFDSLFPMIDSKKNSKTPVITGLILVLAFTAVINFDITARASKFVTELDTEYNHVQIVDSTRQVATIRTLKMNNANHSAIFLKNDDLVFQYTKFYDLAKFFKPNIKKALIIGGGAFTYPRHFLQTYPEATIDVVEIDPKLSEIAKKYFKLEDDPRMNIYNEDGRTFLNNSTKKYDVIFLDAFGTSYSIPYQLTTVETVKRLSELLVDDGLVLTNIISTAEGEQGEFFRAEYYTFKKYFPQIETFFTQVPNDPKIVQNIMMVALKQNLQFKKPGKEEEFNKFFKHLWEGKIPNDKPILTDDFAPVDQYIMKLMK